MMEGQSVRDQALTIEMRVVDMYNSASTSDTVR